MPSMASTFSRLLYSIVPNSGSIGSRRPRTLFYVQATRGSWRFASQCRPGRIEYRGPSRRNQGCDVSAMNKESKLGKPFYRTSLGQAYLGDSLEFMCRLPGESVNLVVTSPPYALHFKKEYGNEDQDRYVAWFLPFARDPSDSPGGWKLCPRHRRGLDSWTADTIALSFRTADRFVQAGRFFPCPRILLVQPSEVAIAGRVGQCSQDSCKGRCRMPLVVIQDSLAQGE